MEKVKVGNDQEKAQSESKSHPKNPRWEKNKFPRLEKPEFKIGSCKELHFALFCFLDTT